MMRQRNSINTMEKWNRKLLPLQFILAVLPLIVRYYRGRSGYSVYEWNSFDDMYHDVFLHYKMVIFIVLSVFMLVCVIYQMFHGEKGRTRKQLMLFFPLLLYLGFVLISTIFSENISSSTFGTMDQKEPLPVLAGYVVVVLYAYLVVERTEDLRQLTGAAVAGAACMAVTGILQAVGRDPLLLEPVQRLFAGNKVIDEYGLFQLTFEEGHAYGTLYNPNYVGSYVVLYIPVLLAGMVCCKKIWTKAACGVSAAGLLIMLFASRSRTGLIAVVITLFAGLLFLSKEAIRCWYILLPCIAVPVIAFFIFDAAQDNLLTNRLKEMISIEKSKDVLKGIDTTGNGVRVVYKDTEFTVQMQNSGADFLYTVYEKDEKRTVTYSAAGDYGYFTLSNGDVIAIQNAVYEDIPAFGLNLEQRDYYFTNRIADGDYKYINYYGRTDECTIPDNVFPGYETVGSGRGYVWGRTIPLLLNNFLIGSGPDTFAVTFPQNDYVARYKGGFDNTIFTRPHNFYLQMGVQTGVLSLIAFLAFYALYFAGCCKRYFFKKFTKPEEWFGFAVFLSTVGFMAAGLANDSLIVVSPVFYLLLGTGMAVNHKLCPIKNKITIKDKKGMS